MTDRVTKLDPAEQLRLLVSALNRNATLIRLPGRTRKVTRTERLLANCHDRRTVQAIPTC